MARSFVRRTWTYVVMFITAVVLALAGPASPADATVAPTLVKDINVLPASSDPGPTVEFGGDAYTFACVGTVGSSGSLTLFRSDGTVGGTTPLATLSDECSAESIGGTAVLNGQLYFLEMYSGLWRTDGTAAGTQLVVDSPWSSGLVRLGSALYFDGSAYDADYESLRGAFMKSDGTAQGTVVLSWGSAGNIVATGSTVFFERDSQLWKSDGTAEGTKVVPGSPTGLAFYTELVAAPSRVYFQNMTKALTAWDLWTSDGTKAGTHRVKDIDPTRPDVVSNLVLVDDVAYFQARDATHGYELWKTDGTTAGTVMVKDIRAGSGSSKPADLIDVGGTLFFTANDGKHGRSLWRSDGTTAGTKRIQRVLPTTWNYATQQVVVGSTLFFAASGVNGNELWKSDGTAAGTVQVADINPTGDSSPRHLGAVGNSVYFSADNGLVGHELWVSDGTAAGTHLVKDLNTATLGSGPTGLVKLGQQVLFAADDGIHGSELWKTDGTAAGTALVKDINPGGAGSLTDFAGVLVGDSLYFVASDGVHGSEIWKTDGTAAGTVRMTNFAGGQLTALTPLGTGVAFIRNGKQLWVTGDGGTKLLKKVKGRKYIGSPEAVGSTLFFFIQHDDYGYSPAYLWKTDGTVTGTVRVSSTDFDNRWSAITASFAGKLFFCPEDGDGLWVSDGTAAGTTRIADTSCAGLAPTPSRLYFVGDPDGWNPSIYVTDGTMAGTTLVHSFAGGASAGDLTALGDSIVFTAADGSNDVPDLWRSDGTAAGTVMLAQDFAPTDLTAIGTSVYFAGQDMNGREPWAVGMTGGVHAIADISPGQTGSDPAWFVQLGSNILFSANDGSHGAELWVMPAN
jgi:ELWxxDGT repeat protein